MVVNTGIKFTVPVQAIAHVPNRAQVVQANPTSRRHTLSHPSPVRVLLSSHNSPVSIAPLPQFNVMVTILSVLVELKFPLSDKSTTGLSRATKLTLFAFPFTTYKFPDASTSIHIGLLHTVIPKAVIAPVLLILATLFEFRVRYTLSYLSIASLLERVRMLNEPKVTPVALTLVTALILQLLSV